MGRSVRTESSDFKAFWDLYGMKLDRISAEKAWNRLSKKDRRAAMEGIAAYREDCSRRGISMMYAQGYLNHRRWEDERTAVPADTVKVMDGKTSAECDNESMILW